jgi:hypothetical protein
MQQNYAKLIVDTMPENSSCIKKAKNFLSIRQTKVIIQQLNKTYHTSEKQTFSSII